ncbi:MAG: UvrB/UvrC motif-containing protein [Clostridia bacterium]|nr:UvrB/UvrC motif-containing protein [Clostridia bacterium]
MLCTKCKKEEATFFYTQTVNGVKNSVALCPACAENAGIDFGANIFPPLFNTFFQNQPRRKTALQSDKRCSLCALTFDDIRRLGKVGCPKCYETFREELGPTIRSIHGTASHSGMTPGQTEIKTPEPKPRTQLEIWQEELKTAIENENYELAAALRDKIRQEKGEDQQ